MIRPRRDATAGIVLILLGLFFLLRQRIPLAGPGPILVVIGAALFAASAARAFRGPLLPAGVCLGLGAGFLLRRPLSPWFAGWATLLLGLAAGFFLVAAVDASAHRNRGPAPLVAGIVLLGVALFSAADRIVDVALAARWLEAVWPWLLVAIGVALVVASLAKRRHTG
jgi:hypothetical protein